MINTIYRKPSNRGRQPFSFPSVVESVAFRRISSAVHNTRPNTFQEAKTIVASDYMSSKSKSTGRENATGELARFPATASQDTSRQEQDGRSTASGPFYVNLGVWTIDEMQICKMGSHGPNNEYVSVGGIYLVRH